MPDDFLATVVGAVIAGLVGLVAVFAQQWFAKRQWVWDHVLGPFYDFLISSTDIPNTKYWGTNPWDEVGWHDHMKVGRKLRTRIDDFGSAVAAFNNAETDFSNHLPWDTIRNRLKAQMKTLLGNFVNGDYLMWDRFGKEGGGYWQFGPFYEALYRETVRNPKSPQAAMKATAAREPEVWALVIETLQLQSPGTLEKVHAMFVADPSFEGSERLGRLADNLRAAAVQRARTLHKILEHRAA